VSVAATARHRPTFSAGCPRLAGHKWWDSAALKAAPRPAATRLIHEGGSRQDSGTRQRQRTSRCPLAAPARQGVCRRREGNSANTCLPRLQQTSARPEPNATPSSAGEARPRHTYVRHARSPVRPMQNPGGRTQYRKVKNRAPTPPGLPGAWRVAGAPRNGNRLPWGGLRIACRMVGKKLLCHHYRSGANALEQLRGPGENGFLRTVPRFGYR